MSITSALTIALSGITAASTRLEQTASNIANATTENYSRKDVTITSSSLGTVGGGVKVAGFSRAENTALYVTLTRATSNDGLRSSQDNYQQQVQEIFGTSASDKPGITTSLDDFINSWKILGGTPESLVNQRQVVQDAVTFTDELKRISSAVEDLDRQCRADVDSSLSGLNSKMEQIADLNKKIAQAANANLSSGNLQDQRDKLVLEVSELTSVTVLERKFGQIALYSSSGYQMVDGGSYRTFSYDGFDITSTSNTGLSLNTALGGGKLEALVNFRATTTPANTDGSISVIQKLRDQLDEIANVFLTTTTSATSGEISFAQAYNTATTEAGELAGSFFTGTNRNNIEVNAALLNGTSAVKVDAPRTVVTALLDKTRTFSADGLNTSNADYSTFVTASLIGFQQSANNASTLADTASSSKDFLYTKHTNETGVNTDQELIKLTEFQQAYSACAHVMSVTKELFRTLETLL